MIEKILDRVKRNGDAAEVFFMESEANEISFEAGILKNAERKKGSGMALRIIHEGHVGFSSTTDPDRIDDMIETARASSRFGKEARFDFPGNAHIQSVDTYDPAIEAYSSGKAVEEGKRAIDELRETCPKGLTYVDISTSVITVRIANTSGLDVSYRTTGFNHDITSVIVEGDSILWISDGGKYGTLTIKTDDYIQKIADLARKAETKAPKISGTMPVIFTAKQMPNLLRSIELGINGKSLVKGDSPLIGREGQPVLGSLTLTDDPFIDGAPGSRPFDDEGIPSCRNVIFKDGIFQTFLFDLDTAGDVGRLSTSSANRGMLSSPEIGTTNLIMSTGESSLDEMINGINEGVIVYGVLGGGQSNMLAGDFALNIRLGFLIRNGEIAGRLIDTMVSGNVYSVFGAIASMSRETRQVGTFSVPDVLFSGLPVTGR